MIFFVWKFFLGGESAARTLLPTSPPGGTGASDTAAAAAAAADGAGVAVDTGPAADPGGVRLLGNVRGYGGASLALERVSAATNRSAASILQCGRRRRRRRSSRAGAGASEPARSADGGAMRESSFVDFAAHL